MFERSLVLASAFVAVLGAATTGHSITFEGEAPQADVVTPSRFLPARASEVAPDSERILLAFNWPEGLRATVETTRLRVRSGEGMTDSSTVSFVYNLDVRGHPDGRLIDHRDFELMDRTHSVSAVRQTVEALIASSPQMVVSPSGELLYLEGLEEYIQRVKSTLMDPVPPEEREAYGQFMAPLLTREVFTQSAAEEWNTIVGAWAGGEMELGMSYEFEGAEPIAALGGESVLYRYSLMLLDYIPCEKGAAESTCVSLLIISVPDPGDVGRAIDTFMSRLSMQVSPGQPLPLRIKDLSITGTVLVITEPRTLIPHHVNVSRTSKVLVEIDGREQQGVEIDRRESRYVYQ